MTFNEIESLVECAENGVYSTLVTISDNNLPPNEQTFADFTTMKEGDNIYLFNKRKIYGIGKMVNIQGDCKFLNFPEANSPKRFKLDQISDQALLSSDKWGQIKNKYKELRWVCTFEPCPKFFKNGIDMDAVLQSNPSAFKMLRAFQQLSFIKIDDKENQALKDILLKRNERSINGSSLEEIYQNRTEIIHNEIESKITKVAGYHFRPQEYYNSSAKKDGLFKRETTLEIALLNQLTRKDKETIDIFGKWDYISRQVVASPFKPISWMDKMDVFGYRYIENYKPTVSKYLVTELKKDIAEMKDVDQLLKYVDWVNNEYAFGDYSMIQSFLVASKFPNEVIEHVKNIGSRKYTTGLRGDNVSEEWSNVNLVEYRYNPKAEKVEFILVV
ncbi:hypothetical protein [Sediminibacillus halophilus]|nr:hypothetical protein [Sediminibacillus halophilus]